MFDLDMIENDWKNNSFCLSDKEIREIYDKEDVTINKYDKEVEKFMKSLPDYGMSVKDRIIYEWLGDEEKIKKIKEIDQLRREIIETKYPKRKYLSNEAQKKIIEGCMDTVFDQTRKWYSFFEGKVSIEKLYYICLESLISCAKYCLHSNNNTFRFYVKESIKKRIIKNIAKWEHISYHNAYCLIEKQESYLKDDEIKEISFNYNEPIHFEKPSLIYERIKNERYYVDYIENVSSDEFMNDYFNVLNELDETERIVMEFVFDLEGNKGLTYKEISEYLGIKPKKISKIKQKVLKKLREDERIIKYKY